MYILRWHQMHYEIETAFDLRWLYFAMASKQLISFDYVLRVVS